MDSLKSLVMNLEINIKTERYTNPNVHPETMKKPHISIFRFQRGIGYTSWGDDEEDIGFDNPQDKEFFHLKQGWLLCYMC